MTGQEDITEITEIEQEVKQKELTQQKEKTDLRLFSLYPIFFSLYLSLFSDKNAKKAGSDNNVKKDYNMFFYKYYSLFCNHTFDLSMFPVPNITTSVIY